MPTGVGRRTVLAAAAASAAVPWWRLSAQPLFGFTHGVASGEPTADSVLLWTRYVGTGDFALLTVEVARDPHFARRVTSVQAIARRADDWTTRVVVRDLPVGEWLWYRWTAPDGARSETGRTRTLPQEEAERFTIALMSCSNLGFGWFNAMAHIAARPDFDLAVHLGDYIYEYGLGTYPSLADLVPGRDIAPTTKLVALDDYRARYASYRRCPDLRLLHARLPMLAVWDDHEFADNATADGAWEHDPENDGSWAVRKSAARRAWREWMPVSLDEPWNAVRIGSLATLLSLETRISGRTASPDLYGVAAKGASLAEFASGEWRSSTYRILGAEQERWLIAELDKAASATKWQVLLQSVPMGHAVLPQEALNWRTPYGKEGEDEVAMLVEAGTYGIPFNMDNWGGFPAQRERILTAAVSAGANLIVTSGDSHNAWGFELKHEGRRAGVELAVPSVTSPGFERWFPDIDPEETARALVAANKELVLANTQHRGYGTLVLSQDGASLTWTFMRTVLERSTASRGTETIAIAD